MLYVEEFVDERLKAWCIHCGKAIANVKCNRDHVPTKSLLSKDMRRRGAKYDRGVGNAEGYLPQVVICKKCNSGFADDERYLLCVLYAVLAGSLYPDGERHPEAANVLRSNRDIVRALKNGPGGQMLLFKDLQPFAIYPDYGRIIPVIVKNARGHAYHELGEAPTAKPVRVSVLQMSSMTDQDRASFESIGSGVDIWPEVGSRMTLQVIGDKAMAGGWMEVEKGRYRYALDWSTGITVRTVIWEYLATETCWGR